MSYREGSRDTARQAPHREELAEMTTLLETLAANETAQTPAMERFIDTLTALVLHYAEEIHPGPDASSSEVLKYLMDHVPLLGSKS